MKNLSLSAKLMCLVCLFAMAACDQDANEPDPVNEEELITSVYLQFVDTLKADTALFSFVDIDGDGGNPPIISNATLSDSTTYMVEVRFLNEASVPADNITEEVIDEGDEHQVFYVVESGLDLIVQYSVSDRNTDVNGRPIGVETIAKSGTVGSGTLTLILRHKPNKEAAGVAQGDLTNAGGETDIELSFIVDIQ